MTIYKYNPEKKELIKAYRDLFQESRISNFEEITNLTLNKITEAYRKKIFQNHPDRARILGINRTLLQERSKSINDSYRKLSDFVQSSSFDYRINFQYQYNNPENKQHPDHSSFNFNISRFDIPKKKLKLGQFLFYCKAISFQELLDAIQWQRKNQKTFGDIARDLELLTFMDLKDIYKNLHRGEKIGQCAIRLGYITTTQLEQILTDQKKDIPRIGEYFILKKIITQSELLAFLTRLKAYNKNN